MAQVEQDEFLQNTLYLSLPKGAIFSMYRSCQGLKDAKKGNFYIFAGCVGSFFKYGHFCSKK